jgi:hypothetical protein
MTTTPADLTAELHAVRAELAQTAAALSALGAAPVPRAEAAARIQEAVAALAARYDARLRAEQFRGAEGPPLGVLDAILVPLAAEQQAPFIAKLHGKALAAMLVAALPPDDAATVPSADRPQRRAALEAQAHDLAVREERLVLRLEALGAPVERRPDADPAVVLLTTLEEAAAA